MKSSHSENIYPGTGPKNLLQVSYSLIKENTEDAPPGKHVILAVDTLPDSSQSLHIKERIITLKNDLFTSCRSLHYSPFLTLYV